MSSKIKPWRAKDQHRKFHFRKVKHPRRFEQNGKEVFLDAAVDRAENPEYRNPAHARPEHQP